MRDSQQFIIDELNKQREKLDERMKGNKLQMSRAQEAVEAFSSEQRVLIVNIGKIDDAIEFVKTFKFEGQQ